MNISRLFVQRYLISLSKRCTGFPGLRPRTSIHRDRNIVNTWGAANRIEAIAIAMANKRVSIGYIKNGKRGDEGVVGL